MITGIQGYMNQGEVNPQDTEDVGEPLSQDTPQEESSEPPPPVGVSLRAKLESINLAETMDEKELQELSSQCKLGFDRDLESRDEWETNLGEWTKLALQIKEQKNYPWDKASNVKYPLLSVASMQFNARAYPALVPSTGKLVNGRVIGKDPDGLKAEKAKRISDYMDYQLTDEMEDWEEDMDRLLIMLPIIGTCFKKTYWDSVRKINCSSLILPKNLVVNYWTKTLDTSERVSEMIEVSPRILKERQMSGIYLADVELGQPTVYIDKTASNVPAQDETTPYIFIEQHTYFDMDEDGYAEPYIVTFDRDSGKILRVVARFDNKGIYLDGEGKLQKIRPLQYYTKYSFIPNPEGGFYDLGFGHLLGPLNESVNTLINQLIDAGSLSNLQSGFLGKGIRLKLGETRFQPGEWKTVNATADDLKKQIFPLTFKEPSNVLFQLMGSLITSGKELASVAEIFTGKMPGQNTPATTTMATIEQGMKVFTAVYKRIFRSLTKEYKKLFYLNNTYLNPQTYFAVLDTTIDPSDFDDSNYDVCPAADPGAVTQSERLMKAQGLLELLPLGTIDPMEVTMRVLEAQEQPNWQKLIPGLVETGQPTPKQAPPDPKLMEMQMKGQLEQQKAQVKAQEAEFKSQLAQRDQLFQEKMSGAAAAQDMVIKAQMAKLDEAIAIHKQKIFSAAEEAKLIQAVQHKQVTHVQEMRHADELAQKQKETSVNNATQ